MKGPQLEVADVVRGYGQAYIARYGKATSDEQRQVLQAVVTCRTAALGGHVMRCNQCAHTDISHNSCRNRHCPKCQGAARAEWLEARAAEVLDTVEYYHTVFTLQDNLRPVALQNKQVVYGILFRSAAETLHTIARDPKHLGAKIGFLAMLHTWGQKLQNHPHIHCVIPGGGISADGQRWIPCRKNFFLPVRVLSSLFRKKFLSYLGEAFEQGKLSFHGKLKYLGDENSWRRLLKSLHKANCVVYTKPPFGGAQQVLKYLARYTHRVAISNQRLLSLEDGKIRFRWRDYTDGGRQLTMTLDAVEFIRRFLLHVLPKGFMRIRYYGFLSNRSRKEKIPLCRKLLGIPEKPNTSPPETQGDASDESNNIDHSTLCPVCGKGRMAVVETIRADRIEFFKLTGFLLRDTW